MINRSLRKKVIFISYESFENLDHNKKQCIINAGFSVFAEYGYTKASVDDIIKKAGISKGSLFYYFKSKQNFFNYLYEYCGKMMEKAIDSPGPDGSPSYMTYTDFFERLNAIQLLKLKANSDYPQMANFIKKIVFDTSAVAQQAIANIIEKYSGDRIREFFKGLDCSKFKDGIDPMMVMQLIVWCSEGCLNQIQLEDKAMKGLSQSAPDFEKVIELYMKYVELFKKNFYKD